MKATVKRLVVDRGFGFLTAEDGKEYFFHRVHCSGVPLEQLQEGDPVDFEPDTAPTLKGPRAKSVLLAS